MWLSIFMILVVKNDEPGAGHTGLCRLIPTPFRFSGPFSHLAFARRSNSLLLYATSYNGRRTEPLFRFPVTEHIVRY